MDINFFSKKRQEMIGIKVKNSCWEKALLSLLGDRAEVWQSGKNYQNIISDELNQKALKDTSNLFLYSKQDKIPLQLPLKTTELELLLARASCVYENEFFIWDSIHRYLKKKKTNEGIYLTEKEGKIIDFISSCPQKRATKEELLQYVWHYTPETETHTVETCIHLLRQKIGKNANKLILPIKKGYRLV